MPRRHTKDRGEGLDDKAASGLSVRDHILDRTIFLIGKKGTTEVTVREIANEAGVNVAAVNYYFSSKEQMFTQMGVKFRGGYDEIMQLLEASEAGPEERLRNWSEEVMRHLTLYPGVLPVMERLMTAEPLDPFGQVLRAAMEHAVERLRSVLSEYIGPVDEDRLTFKLTLLTSALAGPFPRELGSLVEPAARARFLDLLLEHLHQ